MENIEAVPGLLRRSWKMALVMLAWTAGMGLLTGHFLGGLKTQAATTALALAWLKLNFWKLAVAGPLFFAADICVRAGYIGGLVHNMRNNSSDGFEVCFSKGAGAAASAIAGQLLLWAVFAAPLVIIGLACAALGLTGSKAAGIMGMLALGLCFAVWAVFVLWAGVRAALWLPLMLDGGAGSVEAIRGSFRITGGNFWRVLLVLYLPVVAAAVLANVKLIPGLGLSGDLLRSYVLPVVMPAVSVLLMKEILDEEARAAAAPATATAAQPAP